MKKHDIWLYAVYAAITGGFSALMGLGLEKLKTPPVVNVAISSAVGSVTLAMLSEKLSDKIEETE